ncbi:hypothetical protein C1C97_010125 [Kocuria tytonis]|uniref:Bacterial sugar transferase domain-containing protein n=1 Tax=Kocuria tytonis TaxID=2054280 RepID=A0A495A776_9MICC|nr:hypothetical protein C1C97_010125 [Kocuria tytonis]
MPLMTVGILQSAGFKCVRKCAFDIVVASFGLLAALFMLSVAVLAIRIQDGGPVRHRQEHTGIDGVVFTLYKLRSMRVGAQEN